MKTATAGTATFAPIKMMNGRFRVTLLVGGDRDDARSIRKKLANARGIEVRYHWAKGRLASLCREIANDVDFVVLLKDSINHEQVDQLVPLTKKGGLRLIRTRRNMDTLLGALYANGLRGGQPDLHLGNAGKFEAAADAAAAATVEAMAEPMRPKLVLPLPIETEDKHRRFVIRPVMPEPVIAQHKPVAKQPESKAKTKAAEPGAEPVAPIVNLLVAQGVLPAEVPEHKPGTPSPKLAAVAAALFALCQEERVQVMITARSLTMESGI